MRREKHNFLENGSKIFLRGGLDRGNQVETAEENRGFGATDLSASLSLSERDGTPRHLSSRAWPRCEPRLSVVRDLRTSQALEAGRENHRRIIPNLRAAMPMPFPRHRARE